MDNWYGQGHKWPHGHCLVQHLMFVLYRTLILLRKKTQHLCLPHVRTSLLQSAKQILQWVVKERRGYLTSCLLIPIQDSSIGYSMDFTSSLFSEWHACLREYTLKAWRIAAIISCVLNCKAKEDGFATNTTSGIIDRGDSSKPEKKSFFSGFDCKWKAGQDGTYELQCPLLPLNVLHQWVG